MLTTVPGSAPWKFVPLSVMNSTGEARRPMKRRTQDTQDDVDKLNPPCGMDCAYGMHVNKTTHLFYIRSDMHQFRISSLECNLSLGELSQSNRNTFVSGLLIFYEHRCSFFLTFLRAPMLIFLNFSHSKYLCFSAHTKHLNFTSLSWKFTLVFLSALLFVGFSSRNVCARGLIQ